MKQPYLESRKLCETCISGAIWVDLRGGWRGQGVWFRNNDWWSCATLMPQGFLLHSDFYVCNHRLRFPGFHAEMFFPACLTDDRMIWFILSFLFPSFFHSFFHSFSCFFLLSFFLAVFLPAIPSFPPSVLPSAFREGREERAGKNLPGWQHLSLCWVWRSSSFFFRSMFCKAFSVMFVPSWSFMCATSDLLGLRCLWELELMPWHRWDWLLTASAAACWKRIGQHRA